jgi:aryl-alcohol dehydrogenase-like predicted oxidoreductase
MTLPKNKLVLGTVQLGMKYGLNNRHGQPTQSEAFAILDKALAAGIETFDTAYAYGTAEDVLGAWIKDRSLAQRVKVISKLKPHIFNDYPDGSKAATVLRAEVEKSLNRLGLPALDGYLFHSPHYIYLSHAVNGLRELQAAGLVKRVGVSTYDEAEALQAALIGVDYIQVPYNAFDQRLDKTDFFEIAKKNQVAVFARSPFLQGLLLMEPANLPPHLVSLAPQLNRFIAINKRYNLSAVEASLRFADWAGRGDFIVFGVETVAQLETDVALMENPRPLPADWLTEMKDAFRDLNRGAINPSLWSKIKL